jgi:hypothetical protein
MTVLCADVAQPGIHKQGYRMSEATLTCTECGEQLLAERAALGYDYCTKPDCQKKRYRGPKVTAIGVNKSADVFLVADDAEIARRGESGEFGKKNTNLGIGYRSAVSVSGPVSVPLSGLAVPPPAAPRPIHPPALPAALRRRWSRQQEQVVRLYHAMGCNPRQILERAARNNPRLGITAALIKDILATPGRRSR